MEAITFTRVSTDEQEEGFSLEAQKERINAYAQKKELNIVKHFEVVESASKDTRKRFEQMIEYAQNRRGTVAIIVDTVDRITRNFVDSVRLDSLRRSGKIELHFYRENLIVTQDSNSSEIMRWDMAVLFAKQYALQISDNVKRSFEKKRSNGELTGPAPYGYRNVELPDGRKWVEPDPVDAPAVKRMFEMYASGSHSVRSVSDRVKLSRSRVAAALRNPFYRGEIYYKKSDTYRKHPYERIVPDWLFLKVQEVLDDNVQSSGKRVGKARIYYKGLIHCSHCGAIVSGQVQKGKVYYRCYRGKEHGIKYIRQDEVTKQLSEMFGLFKMPQGVYQRLLSALKATHKDMLIYNAAGRKEVKQELERVQRLRSKNYEKYLEGKVEESLYQEKDEEYSLKISELSLRYSQLIKAVDGYYDTSKLVLDLARHARALFLGANPQQKVALLKLATSNIKTNGEKVDVVLSEGMSVYFKGGQRPDWLRIQDIFRTGQAIFPEGFMEGAKGLILGVV